jgi:hypothetical protein
MGELAEYAAETVSGEARLNRQLQRQRVCIFAFAGLHGQQRHMYGQVLAAQNAYETYTDLAPPYQPTHANLRTNEERTVACLPLFCGGIHCCYLKNVELFVEYLHHQYNT